MAEAAPGRPELVARERQNLLAVRRERLARAVQGRFPLHRLLVVAQLGQGTAAEEVAGYHRGLFENALEDHSREQVSGLLLLYSSCMFHVVESCSSTIHLIIRDLASLQNQGHSALLQEIKVLVVAHNIPTRLFPDWHVATATPPATRPRAPTPAQSTAEVVAECLALLLQLAHRIQNFEKLYGLFHPTSLCDTGCIQRSSLQLASSLFKVNLHSKEQTHVHSQDAPTTVLRRSSSATSDS